MESFEAQLTNNLPTTIIPVFSNLVNCFIKKNDQHIILLLTRKCLDPDPVISETARLSILSIINQKPDIKINVFLVDLLAVIPETSNITSLVRLIFDLILFEYQARPDSEDLIYKNIFKHPLVQILSRNKEYNTQWAICNKTINIWKLLKAKCYYNNLLMPLSLYSFCNPCYIPELQLLREKLWHWLIKLEDKTRSNYIYILCGWMQINKKHLEIISPLFYDAIYFEALSRLRMESIGLFLILLINNCIKHNINHTLIMNTTTRIFLSTSKYHNEALLLLSNTILNCSTGHLDDLIKFCSFILKKCKISYYTYITLQSSVIVWNANRCLLTEQIINHAEEIVFEEEQNDKRSSNWSDPTSSSFHLADFNSSKMDYIVMCNPDLFFYHVSFRNLKNICLDKEWLDKLVNVPLHFLNKMIIVLFGLFSSKDLDFKEKDILLSAMINCTEFDPKLYPAVFTFILYHLANAKDNLLILRLLKTLPLMAKSKENRPKVIATVKTMANSKKSTLANYATSLMYDIWEIDYRCFSHLESMLYLPPHKPGLNETYICKGWLLRKLAEKGPEVHGSELVKDFSKIINLCNGADGAVSTSYAIDGIQFLCSAGVIDIHSTFEELKSNFATETRIVVLESICNFLKEIPSIPETENSEIIYEKSVKLLCNWIQTNQAQRVIEAAFNALAAFDVKLIKENLTDYFPKDDLKKQIFLDSGWFSLISKCKPQNAVTKFMVKLISVEINNFLKHIYRKKNEPDNYGYLPTGSLVAILGKYLKNNVNNVLTKWKNTENETIYIQCLEILGHRYTRPLPPFNWFFLQELIHEPSLTNLCLNLASNQVNLSRSARSIVENYIIASGMSKDKSPFPIYTNLQYIANSIQPVTLNPFIKSTLIHFIQSDSQGGKVKCILQSLKEVLENAIIQDVNKKEIENILMDIVLKTDITIPKQQFRLILDCINSFSEHNKELIVQYNSNCYNESQFKIILNIRCYLAKNSEHQNPLSWLNPVFEFGFNKEIKICVYLNEINECIIKNLKHPSFEKWLFNFLEELEYMIVHDDLRMEYYITIFISVAVYASGYFIFIKDGDDHHIFFPAAITSLVEQYDSPSFTDKVLNCMHLLSNRIASSTVASLAAITLCCLRHQEEFSKDGQLKYLECYMRLASDFKLS